MTRFRSEDERRRTLEVREGLRALLWVNSGGKLDREAVRRLDRATSEARFQTRFDETGPIGFEPVGRCPWVGAVGSRG